MNPAAESILNPIYYAMIMQSQRIDAIEEREALRKKRQRLTDAQRFLLLFHSGGLEKILEDDKLTQEQKAVRIGLILDIDSDNAKKFLSELRKKESSKLLTESNYKVLVGCFEKSKDLVLLKKAELLLWEIQSRKFPKMNENS